MKIKNNSWMVWMIDQAFEVKPKSLCSFFWLLVASIVTIPFCYPSLLWNMYSYFIRKKDYSTQHYGVGALLSFLSFAICGKYFEHYYLKNEFTLTTVLYYSPLFLLFMLLSIAAFAGIIYGIIKLVGFIQKKNEKSYEQWRQEQHEKIHIEHNKKPNVIIEYLKAKKQKVCPIIEYED